MTVNPGFGGQAYIATMEAKIRRLREVIIERGLDVDIEVDGGIAPDTVGGAAAAGANVLVAGSALFRDELGARPRGDRTAYARGDSPVDR